MGSFAMPPMPPAQAGQPQAAGPADLATIAGGRQQASPNEQGQQKQQVMAQVQQIHSSLKGMAMQFPQASKELQMCSVALMRAMMKIVGSGSNGESQPVPPIAG